VSRDRQVVAGLDLGSTKTCAVIAEVVGDLPRVPLAKVLGVGLAKNAGVRRGMVRDIDETSRSIVAALRDAERMAGVKVGAVTCGIAGEHVSARTSTGVVAVSGDEITAEDVARVNEVARAVSLGRDHELLHDIPQEYVVDQQRGISDPVGMTGTRLEVEMYLVTVQSTAAQNLRKSVERARYRVGDLVLEPLAASYAVLTDDERELGVALVEVGGGSTGVAIFHEGKIRHLASIKFAGTHVTSDMMQGLGVTQADAERLKERHGVAYQPLVDDVRQHLARRLPHPLRRRGRQRDHLRRVHERFVRHAVPLLEPLHVGLRHPEDLDEVRRHLHPGEAQGREVADLPLVEDRHRSRGAAHVEERDAQFPLVVRQHGVRRRERLEHDVAHAIPGALHRAAQVLRGGRLHRHEVDLDLEPRARHADRVGDAALLVDHVLLRDVVQQLVVPAQ